MGLDAILECENHQPTRQNPKNCYSLYPDSSKAEEQNVEEKPTSSSYLLSSLDDDFGALSINPCRKSMPCRPVGARVENSEIPKRGSVYQSSRDVRKLKTLSGGRRKKIETELNDESFLSFEIVDPTSPCCQSETVSSDQQGRTLISLNADLNLASFGNTGAILANTDEFLDLSFRLLPEEQLNLITQCSDPSVGRRSSSDSYLEICLFPENTESSHAKVACENVERCSLKEGNFKSCETLGLENDGNVHSEREIAYALPKSLSAKVETCNTLSQPKTDLCKTSQRTRFSPIRKILDPIKKSKSQRNTSLPKAAVCNLTSPDSSITRRDKSLNKSLSGDLLSSKQKADYHDQIIDRDQRLVVVSSPAHLHGILKLECKQGVPSFEFSVKDLEDVLSAKTWKTHNAFNWVYTFHSGKRNGGSGWGAKDRRRQSLPMVGQMQVSCYFCSELGSSGSLENSAVTEFILYDVSHVKRSSFAYEERHPFPEFIQPPRGTVSETLAAGDSVDLNDSSVPGNCKSPFRASNDHHDPETAASCPWGPIDLLPHLEVAATVIQIPFGGKRTLKDRLREDMCTKQYTDLPGVSVIDNGRNATSTNPYPVNVKVVTTSGRHGLPSTEESAPSPLLDKWRSGGGCDCGGWDMACPVTVLDNGGENTTDIRGSHLSLKLLVQGAKDKIPALTIRRCDNGLYSVDFHAQLSKLQAFSICVAVLHSLEALDILSQEQNGQRLHSNSLKLLLEEEVRHLIEAVAKEEQRKVNRKLQQFPAPYIVDPPFSPMGRV